MKKNFMSGFYVFLAGAALLLCCAFPVSAQKTGIRKGKQAPDFSVKMTDGTELMLSSLRGKPILLHFWATWCPPCVRELPSVAKISAERSDEITVLAISAGETKETVSEYINSKDGDFSSFVSGCDEDSSISFMYNVTAIPYTLFISADGIITDVQMGAYTPERLKSAVDKAVRTSE